MIEPIVRSTLALLFAFCVPALHAAERTLVVSRDGTGAFASIGAALDSVTNASPENPVTILIKAGTYEEMLTTKDWVNLVGEDRERCIVTYSRKPGEEAARTHVIWATSTSTIKNLTLIGKDVKYCVHSDRGGPYTLTLENCILRRIHAEGDYPSAFGIGLWAGQHIIARNCVLEAREPVYMHNSKGQESSCSMTLEKCTLKGQTTAMLIVDMNSMQRDFIVVHDCALMGNKAILCQGNDSRDPSKNSIEFYVSGNTGGGESVGAVFHDDSRARLTGVELVAKQGTRKSLATPGLRIREAYGAVEGAVKKSAIWEPYSHVYVSSARMTEEGLVLTSEVEDKFGMVTGPAANPATAALPMVFEFRAKWSFSPKGYAEMQYAWKPDFWRLGWRPGEIYDPANPASVVKVNTEEWQTYRLVARSPEDVTFQVVGREAEAFALKRQQDTSRGFKLLLYGKGTRALLTRCLVTGDLP